MTYLAIDFGGGSGRVIAGTLTAGEDGKKRLDMQVIHRFTNRQVRLGERLYWDFPALFADMKEGLRKAAALKLDVKGIAVDTWVWTSDSSTVTDASSAIPSAIATNARKEWLLSSSRRWTPPHIMPSTARR